MNEVFVLEPAAVAVDDGLLCHGLAIRFGCETGLFVAALPEGWLAEVNDLALKQSEVARARIVELIRIGRKRWLLPIEQPELDEDWLLSAYRLQQAGEIEAVLTERGQQNTVPLKDAVIGDKASVLKVRHSKRIKTTVEEYAALFTPLLLLSSELHLVDSYAYSLAKNSEFRLWKEFFLRLQEKGRISRRPGQLKFIIHLWENRRDIPARDLVERKIEEINHALGLSSQKPMMVQAFWRDDDIEHDRHLISVKGAISLGRGLYLGANDKKTTVEYLSEEAYDELYKETIEVFTNGAVSHAS